MKQFKETTIGKRVYTLYVNESSDTLCDWYNAFALEITSIGGDYIAEIGLRCNDDTEIHLLSDYDGVFYLTEKTLEALRTFGFNVTSN